MVRLERYRRNPRNVAAALRNSRCDGRSIFDSDRPVDGTLFCRTWRGSAFLSLELGQCIPGCGFWRASHPFRSSNCEELWRLNSGAFREAREEKTKRTSSGGRQQESAAVSLDRLIHERTRLAIISALAVNTSLTFSELKELLGASDGNLSVHARKLEDAGYVSCTKSFSGRMPKTEYRLTPSGRRALEKYLNHMEALIQATREG